MMLGGTVLSSIKSLGKMAYSADKAWITNMGAQVVEYERPE
jgi:hypothetical protein